MSAKRLKILIYMLAGVIGISVTSCEKVIYPDLKSSEPKIVIEGAISDQLEFQTVRVSRTVDFYQDKNEIEGVKGAQVSITSSANQNIVFNPTTADGVYRSNRFRGTPGLTYTLRVVVDGTTYTAVSTMPQAVRPDSLNFKKLSFFGESRVYPSVYFNDPPNTQNQYRYIVWVNDKFVTDKVSEDRFYNGNTTSELVSFDGDGVQKEDRVRIEMQCIDRNVFKYFYAIGQVKGEEGPPVAPTNPDSNIDNGALGIFSAYTKSTHNITLKQ